MAQTPVTLKVIHQFQCFSNASRLHLCCNLQDFNWHARIAQSLSDSWASCIYYFNRILLYIMDYPSRHTINGIKLTKTMAIMTS